jgi:hypothetical protein
MRLPQSRGLLSTALAAVLGACAGVAVVTAAAANPADGSTTLARPANDRSAQRGADAPVLGTVPGLTGAAAERAAGAAATRFRSMATDRGRQMRAAAAGTGIDRAGRAALAADDLHTAWGTAFAQPTGKGLKATHSVFTGAAAVTHGGDVVYAPTSLPSGGACMEMTTAYTSGGPVLWAWDWCGGNAGVGKLVNIDAGFLTTYTTTVNGQAAYSTDIHQTNPTSNTWSSYLYNYQTHAWDVFYTSSGTYDLGDKGFGWDMFEIYSTRNPATNAAWYCSSMAGERFEASSIQINLNSTWSAATSANSYSYGDPPPPGSQFDCPALTFTMVHANDDWTAQIGGGTTQPGGNVAGSATPSASYTSPWESVAAINDGAQPPSSNDTTNPRWGTWPNQGQQWAGLTWSQSQRLTSAEVYFFDDNGGVRLPASWRLQYWNGNAFVDVPQASGFPVAANQYNRVTFTAVTTTQLRVVLQSNNASVGLLEVRAYNA